MSVYRFFYGEPPAFYIPPSLLLFDMIPHNGGVTVDDFFHGGRKTTRVYSFDSLKEIAVVIQGDSFSFGEETLYNTYFINPISFDPRTKLETEIITPVFEDHEEILELLGNRKYPLPPWVTTWIKNHEDSIDELDKLLATEYSDVAAKRLGFNRKGMKDKCRLDPMFAPILIEAEMDVEIWKMGFSYLRSPMNKTIGMTDFEKSLILQTYEGIMTNAMGEDYRSMVEPLP